MSSHTVVDIDHGTALDVVYHFLLRNGYTHTIRALQLESRRPFNVIAETSTVAVTSDGGSDSAAIIINREGLHTAVMEGRWDVVLGTYLSTLVVHENQLFQLYEHILFEMLHVYRVEPAARSFFTLSPVFKTMKRHSPAQHARLSQDLDRVATSTRRSNAAPPSRDTVVVPQSVIDKRSSLARDLEHLLTFATPSDLQRQDRLPYLIALEKGDSRHHRNRGEDGDNLSSDGRLSKQHRVEGSLTASEAASLASPLSMTARWWCQTARLAAEGATRPEAVSCCRSFGAYVGVPADPTFTVAKPAFVAVFGTDHGRLLVRVLERPDVVQGALVATTSNAAVSGPEGDAPLPFVSFAGHEVLSIDSDVAATPTDGQSDVWIAVGFRGGLVRVYDFMLKKLARKFDVVDALGVHALTFVGSASPLLKNHRGFLVALGLQGTLSVLSIAEGVTLQTILSVHGGGVHVVGMTRLVLPNSADEMMATCGENNTLRFWHVTKPSHATLKLEPNGATVPTASLHPSLSQGNDVSVVQAVGGVRGSTHEASSSLVAFGTKRGTVIVYNVTSSAVVFAARVSGGVTSVDLTLSAPLGTSTSSSAYRLLVAKEDGSVCMFSTAGTTPLRGDAALEAESANSLAMPQLAGCAVSGLCISCAWCNDDHIIGASANESFTPVRFAAISNSSGLCAIV